MQETVGDMVQQLAMQRLEGGRDPQMDALLALYERAIPARERKSRQAIRDLTGSPDQDVVAATLGGEVVGFFIQFRSPKLALLEYMAVDEGRRRLGLGGAMFRHAHTLAGARPLLLEVESEREQTPELALRRQRMAFYRRLGCRLLTPLDYQLPLAGEGPPPIMDLLVHGLDAPDVEAAEVAHWLREIYRGVYGLAQDDPRLIAAIAGMPPRLLLT